MAKYIPPILIGFLAALVTGFLMHFVFEGDFVPSLYGLGVGAFVAYILSNLAGNKKLAIADAGAKAEALKLQPRYGRALLVVYREGFVAKLAGLDLAVDGQAFVQLTSPKFSLIEVTPGAHTLTGAFGGLAGAQSKSAGYPFQAEAGGVVCVRITAQMGMVQGAVKFAPQTDLKAVRSRLASMPMVLAQAAPV